MRVAGALVAHVSDAFWTALPLSIAALGTFISTIVSLYNRRQITQQGKEIAQQGRAIEAVHLATNGMKDDLMKVTAENEYAKGKLEGKAER